MNPVFTCRALLRRIARIHQIPIHVMLENKPTGIEPIIKDLTTHDMPPDPPTVLPTFMPQPIMPQNLRVEIVRLEARVVDMTFGALEEEEAVVVDELGPAGEAAETVERAARWVVDQFTGKKVEV